MGFHYQGDPEGATEEAGPREHTTSTSHGIFLYLASEWIISCASLSSSTHAGLKHPLSSPRSAEEYRAAARGCVQEGCEIIALLPPSQLTLIGNGQSGIRRNAASTGERAANLQQRKNQEPFRWMWVEFTASPKHPDGLPQTSDWSSGSP